MDETPIRLPEETRARLNQFIQRALFSYLDRVRGAKEELAELLAADLIAVESEAACKLDAKLGAKARHGKGKANG